MAYIDLYKLANCEFHILYFKVQTCYLKRLSIKYVRSERGRSGQGKSTLARMDGMRESSVSVRAPIFFIFAGSLQSRNKESELFRQPKLSIPNSPVQLKSTPPIAGLFLVF